MSLFDFNILIISFHKKIEIGDQSYTLTKIFFDFKYGVS